MACVVRELIKKPKTELKGVRKHVKRGTTAKPQFEEIFNPEVILHYTQHAVTFKREQELEAKLKK